MLAEFKKSIEENKDKDLREVFRSKAHNLEDKDHDILRKCRREMFEKRREEHRMRREHYGVKRNRGNF